MTENKLKDLIKLYEGEGGTVKINKKNLDEHNKTTDLIKKREQQKERNKNYYLKNIEKIRQQNLKKYHDKKTTKRKIGRPRKYDD